MPNIWGFSRRSWMYPDDTFFTTDNAAWGNLEDGVQRTKDEGNPQPKTVCTMLIAIRLLYYMGARRIFLLGADFWMAPTYGYGFAQGRSDNASASNNRQFGIVNNWLCQMQEAGTFKRFGLEIYNCFERSCLRAFPFVPFEDAITTACEGIEQAPDLKGWYEKKCKKCKAESAMDDGACNVCGEKA
jgi:hypothetical protein